MFKTLLAKSIPLEADKHSKARKSASYTAHIGAVMKSADVILDRIGAEIMRQLGLTVDFSHFANTVKLGAYLHDWGKANQHFQEMLYLKYLPKSDDAKLREWGNKIRKQQKDEGRSDRHMIRHEVVSAILALQVPSFRAWLEQCPNADLMIAVWAAIGHHLKLKHEFTEIPDNTGCKLQIFTQHHDFRLVLKMGRQYLGLPDALPEPCKEEWKKKELQTALQALCKEFGEFEKSLDEQKQKFVAAVKATVIAADIAGSALPNTEHDIKDWITEVLSLVLSAEDIQGLLDKRLEGKPLRSFQQLIADTNSRVTIVKAGCGTGKSVGAYAWSKTWAKNRKVFFCYPTTGTASQGYLDYAATNDLETALMHSRAAIDLEEVLFSNDSENKQEYNADNDARLAAFTAWETKLIVCTVDTVLGLIQNNRKPLYSFPAIAQGAFVFDEVHAYDNRLFAALLIFIKTFRGAPILLMSASFSPTQLELIQKAVEECGETINIIEGHQKIEQLERYRFCYLPEATETSPEVWQTVIDALNAGKKVLWVTNSVQSCIDIYRQAGTEIAAHLQGKSIERLIYHSRFRYRDRLTKHKAVIEAFKSEKAVFAVTTQVCEMSLDLSADLLISAMAPAAALIQRLGRLNRFVIEDENGNVALASGEVGTAVIYAWKNSKPYTIEELETGKYLITQLQQEPKFSQQQLAIIAAQMNTKLPEKISAIWLEGNWCTYPKALRESGYTVTVLLGEDEKQIWKIAQKKQDELLQKGKKESLISLFKKEAQGWSIPIRIEPDYWDWTRKGFYRITPIGRIQYDEEVGTK
jgi:CRISPR-associated endonuclease/helicase Cas3